MMVCTFIGHSECYGIDDGNLKRQIEDLIKMGVREFLSGGMGDFDWKCARMVFELKKEYPKIKSTLVIPYLNFNIRNKDLFDEILYPDGFEKYYFKSAIIKRNRFLVDSSDYAICYIRYAFGGAAKTYEYAKKKGKKRINI